MPKTQKNYKTSLFIFRRDLRLSDNTGLNAALKNSEIIIPCFIFDPRQVDTANQYRSNNALQFMLESLEDLEQQCVQANARLFFFYGHADKIIRNIIETIKIDAIFCNRDYTPFSTLRDDSIAAICNQHNVDFQQYEDALLINPKVVLTKKGSPFIKFTAFYTAAIQTPVDKPKPVAPGVYYKEAIQETHTLLSMRKTLLQAKNPHIHVHGGTQQGQLHLNSIGRQKNYTHTHNFPSHPTSNMSAYLKFGCLSVRTVYYAINKELNAAHPLIRQLYWRDFFTYVAFHNPHVFGHAFQKKYDQLSWKYTDDRFNAWCTGTTGFPLVDAGMRQLNRTGYIHNRVRMIAASFLVKDLHINWLEGERYFAQKLVDYDPALNNGNWQWCASTGCDAQPYFRIFNPWLQQKKFDPECTYIKQWIPELQTLEPNAIHGWYKTQIPQLKNYPKPIVDHAHESTVTKKIFRSINK